MKQTLYVHLGHGRCGSTSIQRFASDNGEALSPLGVSYPSPAEIGLETTYKAKSNAQALYLKRRDVPSPLELIPGFLEREEHPKVLMSSEWLMNGDAQFVRGLVEKARSSGAEVVAIVYLREQREWFVSRYAQGVKSKRWTISLDEYVAKSYRNRKLDYHRVLSKHAEIFGKENLVIRLFERPKLHDGDVRIDAFDQLGADVRDLVTDDPQANASPTVEELEVMRFMNQRAQRNQFDPREFLRNAEELRQEAGWEPRKDLYRLASPELLRQVGEHFSESNEAFRQEFLPGEPSPAVHAEDSRRVRAAEPGCVDQRPIVRTARGPLLAVRRRP